MNFARGLGLCALMLLAACSFDRRSGAFECSDTEPCTDPGRVCENGWCVIPGSGGIDGTVSTIDAMSTGVDAFVCPAECSRCEGALCVIECAGSGDCAEGVQCPTGVACRVDCSGDNSCAGGVECLSPDCDINCSGINACATQIECGTGRCDVNCSGVGSCAAGLDCSDACECVSVCPNGCGPNLCLPANPCESGGLCQNSAGACRNC